MGRWWAVFQDSIFYKWVHKMHFYTRLFEVCYIYRGWCRAFSRSSWSSCHFEGQIVLSRTIFAWRKIAVKCENGEKEKLPFKIQRVLNQKETLGSPDTWRANIFFARRNFFSGRRLLEFGVLMKKCPSFIPIGSLGWVHVLARGHLGGQEHGGREGRQSLPILFRRFRSPIRIRIHVKFIFAKSVNRVFVLTF